MFADPSNQYYSGLSDEPLEQLDASKKPPELISTSGNRLPGFGKKTYSTHEVMRTGKRPYINPSNRLVLQSTQTLRYAREFLLHGEREIKTSA
ncbi:MAG: hypothetical protein Q9215_006216 [Flavoplaca cf. flavocitrina]